jgi:hypothetical protein
MEQPVGFVVKYGQYLPPKIGAGDGNSKELLNNNMIIFMW